MVPDRNAQAYLDSAANDIANLRQMLSSSSHSAELRSLFKVVDALYNAVQAMNKPGGGGVTTI